MAQNINVTSLFYVNIDNNNKITKLIPNTTVNITQVDIDSILNYYNKYGFLIMDFSINTNLNDINSVFMNLVNNNTNNINVTDKDNTIVRITSNTANIILNSGLIFKIENAEKIVIPKVYFSIDKNNFLLNLEKIFPSNDYIYNMIKNILQNSFNYIVTLDNYNYEMLLNKFINTILLTSFNTEIYNYFGRNNRLSSDIMNNIINYFSGELCMFNYGVVNIPPNLCVINNLTEKHCFNFLDPLQKNIYDLTTNNISNTTKINNLNTQISSLTADKSTCNTNLSSITSQLTTTKGIVTNLTNEKTTLQSSLDTANKNLSLLNSQFTSLTNEKNILDSQCKSSINELNTKVTDLTNTNNQTLTNLNTCKKEGDTVKIELIKLTDNNTKLKISVDNANIKADNESKLKDNALKSLDLCNNQTNIIKSELNNEKANTNTEMKLKEDALNRIDKLNNDKNILSESKFECDNNVTDLNNKLTKSKSDIKTLNETLIYEETDKIRIINLYNNLTKDYTDVNAQYIAEQLISKKIKQELKTLKEESEGFQMNFSTINLWTGTTIVFLILFIVFATSKK
jgi:hypothetical protein